MNSIFSDVTIQLLEKALDVAVLRQRVISNNIANINTPGFKRSYVTFEEELQKVLRDNKGKSLQTGIAHLQPEVHKDTASSIRSDGNNVDMDQEMTKLAMNAINYNTAVKQLNKKFAMLRYVISEGRR